MKIAIRRGAFFVFMLSMAITSGAQAALVEWTFTASVRDIDGSAAGMAEFGVSTGTLLSATYLLDTSVTGNAIAGNTWFDGAVVGIDVNAGIFQASLDTSIAAFNTVLVRDQSVDAVGVSAALLIDNGTDIIEAFLATQFISSDGLLVDNTLFPSLPDFSHIDSYDGDALGGTFFLFQAEVNGVFTSVTAEIFQPEARFVTQPVPIPGALLLMGSGLFVLLRLGQPRR